jgi:cbb3-type cytochrome oxidase cytochrome c subunit
VSLSWGQDAKLIDSGRKIFIEKRCYTCHTINAEAKLIEKEKEEFAKAKGVEVKPKEEGEEEEEDQKTGGDLSDVGKLRDTKWIQEFVQNPKDYFKDDPACAKKAKKKYRKRFKGTNEELSAVVAYLSSLKHEKKQEKDFKSCLKE